MCVYSKPDVSNSNKLAEAAATQLKLARNNLLFLSIAIPLGAWFFRHRLQANCKLRDSLFFCPSVLFPPPPKKVPGIDIMKSPTLYSLILYLNLGRCSHHHNKYYPHFEN